ncbi:MAG: methyltransferase domain-containing protein [bacterium]
MPHADLAAMLVCPRCRGGVAVPAGAFATGNAARAAGGSITCSACPAIYPIRFGIPDFRLEPDPWISIDDEVAKIARVLERARGGGFAKTVCAYWEETPGTPAPVAARYALGVTRPIARETWMVLRVVGPAGAPAESGVTPDGTAGRVVLDAGCGSGALAAAAASLGFDSIGFDVALRWLVIARRRFEEMGLGERAPFLVAASANALPLRAQTMHAVVGDDVLDHLRDPRGALDEFRRVLAQGGLLHQTSPNRYSIALEPHARIPALGFLPRTLRPVVARALRGVDYREVFPLSAGDIEQLLRGAGFESIRVEPATLSNLADARAATRLYERIRATAPGRALLRAVGPLLEATARSPLTSANPLV